MELAHTGHVLRKRKAFVLSGEHPHNVRASILCTVCTLSSPILPLYGMKQLLSYGLKTTRNLRDCNVEPAIAVL